jgi:hypothetical protein
VGRPLRQPDPARARKRWGAVIFPWHLYLSLRVRWCSAKGHQLRTAELTTRNWLDFRDRYAALQSGGPWAIHRLVRRVRRLFDIGSEPFFAWMDRRRMARAQIELYAARERS